MASDRLERIEEAHGLWELAVVRVAALADAQVRGVACAALSLILREAVEEERAAFAHWKNVSIAQEKATT